jgi:hypothetical protein
MWKTKVETALADLKAYNGEHHLTLLPPQNFDPAHPRHVPPAGMQKMSAVLPVGTRVRIERLMKDNGSWGGVRVTASLDDGKVVYLGSCLLARNRFIGGGPSEVTDWGVEPDMLEK